MDLLNNLNSIQQLRRTEIKYYLLCELINNKHTSGKQMLVLPFEVISAAEDEQVHRPPYTELAETINNNKRKSSNSRVLPGEILSYLPQSQTFATL